MITTEADPIILFSETVIFGLIVEFEPIKVPSPILQLPKTTLFGDNKTFSEIFVLWHIVAFIFTTENFPITTPKSMNVLSNIIEPSPISTSFSINVLGAIIFGVGRLKCFSK